MWFFWSTKTKTLSSSPPKQVLGPIARFRPKRNASIVFYLFKLLFVIYRQKYLKCDTFGQQTPKFCQMDHQNKFWAQLPVFGPKETQLWFLISLISSLCLAPKVSQLGYFWSTNTKRLSNAPPKQVLSPISRFSHL